MNAAALARDVALPLRLHGQVRAVCVVDRVDGELRHRVAWFDGLRKEVPEGPSFRKPGDAIALANFLNGADPTPRGRPRPVASGQRGAVGQAGAALEAPEERPVASSTCPGCGGPLPVGRRGQARTACSASCRSRVARMRASTDATPSRSILAGGS